MKKDNWKIWNKDDLVEQRTYKRVTGELSEMECAKQLVNLISTVYEKGMKVLDVGCAAGHYYNGLVRIDPDLNYYGIDATKAYVDFAKNHFKENNRVAFEQGDIFNIDNKHNDMFDIVYCANVILHLPSFQEPVRNLLKSTGKYCFIRTLLSSNTHLSKYLYSDKYDENGEPLDFVFQNTYSFQIMLDYIKSLGDYDVKFIDDEFDSENINNEFNNYNKIQGAVTKVQNKLQIAGSKVFEWKWIKITKK